MIDLIASFGYTVVVIRDLKAGLFRDDVGRALRVKLGSDEMRIIYLHGVNARSKARDNELNPAVDLQGAARRACESLQS